MATGKLQANMLYKLLKLKKKSVDGNLNISDLNDIIGELAATMSPEEVERVKEVVEEF